MNIKKGSPEGAFFVPGDRKVNMHQERGGGRPRPTEAKIQNLVEPGNGHESSPGTTAQTNGRTNGETKKRKGHHNTAGPGHGNVASRGSHSW